MLIARILVIEDGKGDRAHLWAEVRPRRCALVLVDHCLPRWSSLRDHYKRRVPTLEQANGKLVLICVRRPPRKNSG